MSNISENLKAYSTRNQYHKYKPLKFVEFHEKLHPELPFDTLQEYEVGCVLKTSVIFGKTHNEKEYAIKAAQRAILEGIFGEFRKDFYELERAIYSNDTDEARALLTKISSSMFDY